MSISRPLHSLAITASKPLPLIPGGSKTSGSHLRLLTSCKNLKSLFLIHAQLLVSGLQNNNQANTHLINLYSSFNKCNFSQLVFDSAINPPVILWNSMIRAHIRSDQIDEALNLYKKMIGFGVEPDKHTFTFVLKACVKDMNLEMGCEIHKEVERKGLESDVYIGTGLVDLYCKLGELSLAREVFDKITYRDVVAWNAMISGFSQSSYPDEAVLFFKKMQLVDVQPNSVSLLNLFPAVCKLKDIKLSRCIHGFVIKREFGSEVFNGLIDMYSKCGGVDVASRVFARMEGKDDISWGSMMAGYAYNGCYIEVLTLFDQMNKEKIKMNKVSVVSALLAAAEMGDVKKGHEIHDCSIQEGFDSDTLVATPLMSMYAKCGEPEKARKIFEKIQKRDFVAWSALLAAYVQIGFHEEALFLFREMLIEDLKPNRVTMMSALPACGELLHSKLGRSLHCYAVKTNVDSDMSTATALVSMYAKLGDFTAALSVFSGMPQKDIVTWNSLINGYAQIGDAHSAIETFRKLQLSGMLPDAGTMVGVIPASTLSHDLKQGSCLHGWVIKCGFELDCHVHNALIDMYAKCGSLLSAEFLFTKFTKDVVSWNSMISGYLQNGHAVKAIASFHHMRLENQQPNLVTIVSVLPAAAYLAALKEGMAFHAYIIKVGFQSKTLVGNSLVDMYAKCGQLDYSENLFYEMENKTTVSWNAMLAGYAVHGYGDRAIELFTLMQELHVEVDSVSFVSILSACRHAGLVHEGKKIFYSMAERHHIEPDLEHYACMVDLLGRSGLFDETLDFIKSMPIEPDAGVWGALLGACRLHSNVSLGEVALDHLVKLEPGNATHYVVLSSIYAQSGRWGDAKTTRLKMNDTGLSKIPGCSWVEHKNKVHAFKAGDRSHPQFESMSLLWSNLLDKMEKMGYVPDRSCVLQNVEEEDKDLFLFSHSERLAITFALLGAEPGSTIQVVKNLRVCTDCHTVIKFIAKITSRKIIVRDANRFHHFEDEMFPEDFDLLMDLQLCSSGQSNCSSFVNVRVTDTGTKQSPLLRRSGCVFPGFCLNTPSLRKGRQCLNVGDIWKSLGENAEKMQTLSLVAATYAEYIISQSVAREPDDAIGFQRRQFFSSYASCILQSLSHCQPDQQCFLLTEDSTQLDVFLNSVNEA
ncbi:DYW domain [Dillenia turbinata]|uniref:DYW domain n=1 Tax=Dillenia turbinata TaxID=194707 RepID=A0AAN8VK72_9MAGN